MQQQVHFQQGSENQFAFVFSCPGREEEKAGYPAAKMTGINLAKLFVVLNEMKMKDYHFARERVTITNAWANVEYDAKTCRSEATNEEVLSPENLLRLGAELKAVTELIVGCGQKARLAIQALAAAEQLHDGVRIVFINHLGMKSINQIARDIHGEPIVAVAKHPDRFTLAAKEIGGANTRKRLEVVAAQIKKGLLGN
ncbi:hypothetical protein [Anaerospora hongkongensis]|uniref:hypothetical protein n=1 Tax=Anaerospora hongkongensis TaxID=244830 RepID=UPI00289F7480|nr:hypothetical protein [Anaerospora hongkongensis]